MSYSNNYNTHLKFPTGAMGGLKSFGEGFKSFTGGSSMTKVKDLLTKHGVHVLTILLLFASLFCSVHGYRMSDPVKNASTTLTKEQKLHRLQQARHASVGGMVCDALCVCLVGFMVSKL